MKNKLRTQSSDNLTTKTATKCLYLHMLKRELTQRTFVNIHFDESWFL